MPQVDIIAEATANHLITRYGPWALEMAERHVSDHLQANSMVDALAADRVLRAVKVILKA